jgi:hypothetical protein
MKLSERRRAVLLAEQRLQIERGRWRTRWFSLQARLAPHRTALILGGGAASGFVAGLLPLRGFARVGSLMTSIVSFALRSPIGAMLFEGLTRAEGTDTKPDSSSP